MESRSGNARSLVVVLGLLAMALASGVAVPALAQGEAEVYTATAIASEGMAGSTGRISIRIVAYTSDAEKQTCCKPSRRTRKPAWRCCAA